MLWECSECGECIERDLPPVTCRSCGTAGARFVAAEEGLAGAPHAESLYQAWVECGMDVALAA